MNCLINSLNVIGYSLIWKLYDIINLSQADNHLNDLLKQSLEAHNTRKLLIVDPYMPEHAYERVGMSQDDAQVVTNKIGAKDFLSSILTVDYLGSLLPDETTPF